MPCSRDEMEQLVGSKLVSTRKAGTLARQLSCRAYPIGDIFHTVGFGGLDSFLGRGEELSARILREDFWHK